MKKNKNQNKKKTIREWYLVRLGTCIMHVVHMMYIREQRATVLLEGIGTFGNITEVFFFLLKKFFFFETQFIGALRDHRKCFTKPCRLHVALSNRSWLPLTRPVTSWQWRTLVIASAKSLENWAATSCSHSEIIHHWLAASSHQLESCFKLKKQKKK